MTQHSFSVSKITRRLTGICTCVLICVGVYSFTLGFRNLINRQKTVSTNPYYCEKVIIIDPGHGGEDGGAQSSSGIIEKGINLSIGRNLNDLFNFFGYKTIMTRDEDCLIYDSSCNTIRQKKVSDLRNRLSIIESCADGVFLSIHQNHYEGSSSVGTQVFYSPNNPQSEKLAQSIQKTIVFDIQPENKRMIKKSGSEIFLLKHSQLPSVMVECGFLSNEDEAQKLNNDVYQQIMAFEIFKGTINSGG